MKIISVFGASGAGKGTVKTMLCMLNDRLHGAKFARPMKKELEEGFALSEGLLEHRCIKSLPTFQRGSETFLDLMVKLYHERQDNPTLPSDTLILLSQCQAYGLVPVFDDCRNDRESDALAQHDVYGVWVESDSGVVLTSDLKQWEIYSNLLHKTRITNNETFHDLMFDVERLYERSIKRWLDS